MARGYNLSRFHLSGPRMDKRRLADVAGTISARTAWECVSSWLVADDDLLPGERASVDLEDMEAAQAVVVVDVGATKHCHGQAPCEVMVELGAALARETPVSYVTDRPDNAMPTYLAHPLVTIISTENVDWLDWVCGWLESDDADIDDGG